MSPSRRASAPLDARLEPNALRRGGARLASTFIASTAVWTLAACLLGCGGPDLAINGSIPATATAGGGTPTPTTCSGSGGACDDVTIFCCSPFTCVAGGICE